MAGIVFIMSTSIILPTFGLLGSSRPGLILLGLFVILWSALLLRMLDTHPYRFGFIYLLGLLCIGGGLSLLRPLLRFTVWAFRTIQTMAK